MCIIAIQPRGKKIKESVLRNCWENNNDGAGLMYSINGKIYVEKELDSFERFLALKKRIDTLNVNLVMHFRISTSGLIDEANIHPFKVNDSLYFCHNGVLDITVPNGSKINDTQIFRNVFLRGLDRDFIYNESARLLIEYAIGNRNKFVFLDNKGQFFIINEMAGTWDKGCWYSNTTYTYSYSSKYTSKGFDYWDSYEVEECECCGCKHKEIEYVDEWEMSLCPTCNDFAKIEY